MAFFWLRDGDRGKALARVRHSRPRDRYPSISSMFNTARGHGATPTPSDYAQIGRHDFSGKIDSPPPVGSRPTTKATYGRRCSRPCRTTVLRVLFFFWNKKKPKIDARPPGVATQKFGKRWPLMSTSLSGRYIESFIQNTQRSTHDPLLGRDPQVREPMVADV